MKKIKKMNKGEMINQIIGLAKSSAISANKHFEGADLFFTLAFRSEKELSEMCKKLNIV